MKVRLINCYKEQMWSSAIIRHRRHISSP